MQTINLLKAADIETSLIAGLDSSFSVVCDSRLIKPGDLFVAIPNKQTLAHVNDAIRAGAKIVVAEELICSRLKQEYKEVSFIPSPTPRLVFSKMVSALYHNQQPKTIVAVTGTNGKSSTVNMLFQFWNLTHLKAAALGTLGLTLSPDLQKKIKLNLPNLTSLGPVEFHQALNALKAEDINHLAIEASSHGLDQYRHHGAEIEAAAFTNLTQDHLDYHPTMEEYFKAKAKLFTEILPVGKTAVLNADSSYFERLHSLCIERKQKVLTYGLTEKADLYAKNIQQIGHGVEFDLVIQGESFLKQRLNLAGQFQLENLLCAMALGLSTGLTKDILVENISSIKSIKGRMEFVGFKNNAPIFVDFAHTPDALECALKNLRPHTKGNLWVVFGCGGNRDAVKRPLMGQIAEKFADKVIVTDDNPRFEEPAIIRQMILEACTTAKEVGSRGEAIAVAIAGLKEDDVLLIAGKGHESGQIVGDIILPFSDQDEVLKHI